MPNWCFTDCAVIGDDKELKSLYKIMKRLEAKKEPSTENDFGPTWLGCLVEALGEDYKNVYCRGWWEGLEMEDGMITFFVESAWSPSTEVFDFIQKKFPSLKVLYYAEEEGMGIYQTNDKDAFHFTSRYIAKVNTDKDDYEEEYFEQVEDAYEWISEKLDVKISSMEELKKLDEQLQENDYDHYCYIIEIEVVP